MDRTNLYQDFAGCDLVFLLELGPMVGLTLWRIALKRGTPLDTRKAAQWATTGWVQVALVVALVCAGGIYALIKLAPPPPVVEEYY